MSDERQFVDVWSLKEQFALDDNDALFCRQKSVAWFSMLLLDDKGKL